MKYAFLLRVSVVLSLVLVACEHHENQNPVSSTQSADSSQLSLSISKDSVLIDPYGVAPLTALVSFRTPYAATSSIIVYGKHGDASNFTHSFNDAGYQHSLSIVGLYANSDNLVRIMMRSSEGALRGDTTIHLATGSLPPGMPSAIDVISRSDGAYEQGLNLVSNYSSATPQMPLMIDCYGDIRWVLDYRNNALLQNLGYEDGIARLHNGNFFFGDASSNAIYEVDVLGKVINVWSLSYYRFHHEVYEKPDGNFLISVSKVGSTHEDGTPTVEDYIIELNRYSGAIINEWDLKQCLDESRHVLTTNSQDWAHVNAVCYDASDNTIIVSCRVQGIVKLRYDNSIVWIMGNHRGWGTNRRGEDLNQYLLQPLDAQNIAISDSLVLDGSQNHPDFEWNWCQHSVILLPSGHLMMFDNGDQRNFNSTPPTWYSRAVEFAIDAPHRTVKQVWEYGKERGSETFSRVISSVKYLPNTNHILFSPGYQVPTAEGYGGRMVEIDYETKAIVFEMTLTDDLKIGWHRVYRMDAYQ